MIKFLKQLFTSSIAITTLVFTFVPEQSFSSFPLNQCIGDDWDILLNRVLVFLLITSCTFIALLLYRHFRCFILIKRKNYKIKVEYGDLFSKKHCLKVIAFDECFTSQVGEQPHEIKAQSICGQFLMKFPNEDIPSLIAKSGINKCGSKSEFSKGICYKPGTIVRFDDEYLLLAFAKLDESGLGKMTREEYLSCLFTMWEEIDKHYNNQDVAIPVFGDGITRFRDADLSKQELVDIIIRSYQLSPYKIKSTLHIVCKESDNFSLNKVEASL